MNRLLVWDLPVRLFHLLLGLTFLGAFTIANAVDDDSVMYAAHMLLGLVMVFMVVLRIVWGFVGTRHARFADFVFGPRAVLGYFRAALTGKAERHAGHNPGSSVAIFGMLALVLAVGVSGILVADGNRGLKDVHGLLSWGLVIAVGAHLLGVLLHTIKQRDNITRSMIDGRKEVEPALAIPHAHPIVGLVFLTLVGLWSWRLVAGFDPATRNLTVPFIGATLKLGDTEDENAERRSKRDRLRAEDRAREHDDD